MKRLGERFKQSLGITSGNKDFKPTSNARNNQMEQDVRRFAQQLKAFLKEAKDMSTAIETGLATFKTVLLSPLPRAHDETPAGVVPMDREEHAIGLNSMPEGLAVASSEMTSSIQGRVISPLEEWLNEYRKAKKMNEKCEEIRLDLDNKRRTTMALQEKLAKHQAVNHKDTDSTKHKTLNETDKLNRLAERYAECEAEVFNAFLRLIRDSAVLRDIMAEAVAIYQRTLTTAFTAFNVGAPTSLPQIPAPVNVPLLTYTPVDVNAVGSQRLTAEQAAALTAGSAVLPMKSALSSRPQTLSSNGGSPLQGMNSGMGPAAGPTGGSVTGPYGRAPSPNGEGVTSGGSVNFPRAATMATGSAGGAYAGVGKGPMHSASFAVHRSAEFPSAASTLPAPPAAPAVSSPSPMTMSSPSMPTRVSANGAASSATSAPPPPAWHPSPSLSPAKPLSDESENDSNPFNAAPAAPTHEVALHAPAPAAEASSGDPSNPFKAGRSQEHSEDGQVRPQAIAA